MIRWLAFEIMIVYQDKTDREEIGEFGRQSSLPSLHAGGVVVENIDDDYEEAGGKKE